MSPKSSDKTPEPSLLQVVPTWTKSSPHPPRMDVPYQEAGHESSDSESPMSSPMSSPLPPRLENPAMRTGNSATMPPSIGRPLRNFWRLNETNIETPRVCGNNDNLDVLRSKVHSMALRSGGELRKRSDDRPRGSNGKLTSRQPETNPPKDGPGSFFKKMLSKGDAKRQEDDGGEDGSGPEGRTSQGTKAILTGGPWPTSDRHR